MKEGYFGRIKNSGGQQVKAVYQGNESIAPKTASYAGNGVSSGFAGKKSKTGKKCTT